MAERGFRRKVAFYSEGLVVYKTAQKMKCGEQALM